MRIKVNIENWGKNVPTFIKNFEMTQGCQMVPDFLALTKDIEICEKSG